MIVLYWALCGCSSVRWVVFLWMNRHCVIHIYVGFYKPLHENAALHYSPWDCMLDMHCPCVITQPHTLLSAMNINMAVHTRSTSFYLTFLAVTTCLVRWGARDKFYTLQWRHNERDGVSNHWRLDGLLNRLFRRRSNKHLSSASLAFVRGIHRSPVNPPHKGPVTRKMFPFEDVIMTPVIKVLHTVRVFSWLVLFVPTGSLDVLQPICYMTFF